VPPSTLLLTRSRDAAALGALCARLRADRELVVVGPGAAQAAPHRHLALPLDETTDVAALAATAYHEVLLHGFADDELLPSPILRDVFSRRIDALGHVDEAGRRRPYRPFARLAGQARVLNVFPGAPIPLDKGANQRVFNLTWYLNRAGIATDLLVTTASARELARLPDLLAAIAPTVHTYRNDKPMLPPRLRLRRELERGYRLLRGRWRAAPDLFADRLATRASRDGKARLAELVRRGPYRAVIVNFAWMTGLVDAARPAGPRALTWICDTHDTQFVRGETLNRRDLRLGVDAAAERAQELAALARYDAVLAISPADRERLGRELAGPRVILAPSGFDYAFQALPGEPVRPPFTFGFIGRDMEPNRRALEQLADDWWPAIARAVPGSRLLLAGSICRRREATRLVRAAPAVERLGFVPTLAAFYRRIDIALNPVVVQGGLNFKSVEALAAGRLLCTTAMGARCLGDDPPVVVADAGAGVADAVRALAADPAELHARRQQAQAWCAARFFEASAYRELVELLGD
jgi:polysaccharide biosynthesis protein PslH